MNRKKLEKLMDKIMWEEETVNVYWRGAIIKCYDMGKEYLPVWAWKRNTFAIAEIKLPWNPQKDGFPPAEIKSTFQPKELT